MIFLRGLLQNIATNALIERYHLDEIQETTREELIGTNNFRQLLIQASKSKYENPQDAPVLLLSGTLELIKHCIIHKNLTTTMCWLAQEPKIDEEIKVGVFQYVWFLKGYLGGDHFPINIKAD